MSKLFPSLKRQRDGRGDCASNANPIKRSKLGPASRKCPKPKDSFSRLFFSQDTLTSQVFIEPLVENRCQPPEPNKEDNTKSQKNSAILVRILGYLDDPNDLLSAIQASRSLLGVFRASLSTRTEILKQVITRSITPGAMGAALGLLNCPKFEEGDEKPVHREPHVPIEQRSRPPQPRMSKWEAKTTKFLQKFKQNHAFSIPEDLGGIVRLYRLYHRIHRILPHLVSFVLERDSRPKLVEPYAHSHAVREHRLTPTELGRLQRAIFHYEIHCRLIDIKVARSTLDLPKGPPSLCLAPHEAEEVIHVRDYLEKQYSLIFGEHEADFSRYLECQAKKDTQQPGVKRVKASRLVFENWEHFPYLEHLFPASMRKAAEEDGREFEELDLVHEYMSRLVGFGLDFFYHFTKVPSDLRGDFIKETMWPLVRWESHRVELYESGKSARSKRGRSAPSHAWKVMAKGSRVAQRSALRRFGWVFWDHRRLAKMGLSSLEQLSGAAQSADPAYYRAGSKACLPGLKMEFRRRFFSSRVKREWGMPVSATGEDQKRAMKWAGEIQARKPGVLGQWVREVQAQRSTGGR